MDTVTFKLTQRDRPSQTHICKVPLAKVSNKEAIPRLRGGKSLLGYAGGLCGQQLVFFLDASDPRVTERGCVVEYDSGDEAWAVDWYCETLVVEVLEDA